MKFKREQQCKNNKDGSNNGNNGADNGEEMGSDKSNDDDMNTDEKDEKSELIKREIQSSPPMHQVQPVVPPMQPGDMQQIQHHDIKKEMDTIDHQMGAGPTSAESINPWMSGHNAVSAPQVVSYK